MPATRRPAAEALVDPIGALGVPVAADASGRARAVLAGVVAGVAFVAVEIVSASAASGAAPRSLLRELAAAAIAGGAPDAGWVVTLAGALTIVLAAAYGALVVAWRRSHATAWWTGAVAGLTVYVVNFYYLLAPALALSAR